MLSLDWGEVWHYRDLFFIFAKLEYVTKIKQTVLGPLWYILHPIFTALVFFGIFTKVVRIPSDGVPPMLFYLCGLLAWTYFAQCLGSVGSFLTLNAHLFKKVYIPRLIVPLSVILAKLIPFAIQFAVFLVFYAYYFAFSPGTANVSLQPSVVLLPLFLIQIAALGLGVGLCVAAFSVRYRDLQHVTGILIQLWMYATPVIYSGTLVSDRWKPVMALNPMAPMLDMFRHMFFGTPVDWSAVGPSVILTAVILVVGLIAFSRVDSTFVDTI